MKNKTEEFVVKAKLVHGDKYDYSRTIYENCDKKVVIICPLHGEFQQTPYKHVNMKQNCRVCGHITTAMKNEKDVYEFIRRAKNIHGNKYNYNKTKYLGIDNKLNITCFRHGEFKQTAYSHLKGHGCPKCSGNNKLTTNDFIEKVKEIHNNKYNYSKVKYVSAKKEVIIICPLHGDFNQKPNHHQQGSGCPICSESKGERKIRKYLIENNIQFTSQKRFKDCRDINTLPFDFYLPEYNICVEYDGEQHYKPINRFGGIINFLTRQKRDKIKTKYCYNNNITLIRISYKENIIKKIEKILKK